MKHPENSHRVVRTAIVTCLNTVTTADAAETWDRLYTRTQVTGPDVVAIWQFQPGAETADGKGEANITLHGKARIVRDKRFGGALESFCSGRGRDIRQGAMT